jgi:hypothetical protein
MMPRARFPKSMAPSIDRRVRLDSRDDAPHQPSRGSLSGRWPPPSIAAARTVRLMTTSINVDDDRINVDDGVDKRGGRRGTVDDRAHGSRRASPSELIAEME